MEDKDKKLYPFRFLEDKEQRPWGEVCYKIADLGLVDSRVKDGWLADNKLSELMGTFMERVVGDDSFEYYGLQFPIMIKSFETSGWQPLQVNVPDAEAEARYDSFGKTALWYVLDAKPGSEIHIGLGRDISSDEFYRRCLDSSVSEVLNVIHPKAGDAILIEPGTLFAAGPGLTIVEISECSEMTFDIHDFSPTSDHDTSALEEAFDLITYNAAPIPAQNKINSQVNNVPGITLLAQRDEFKVTRMELRDPLHIFSDQPGPFALYHCLKGEAIVRKSSEELDFQDVTVKEGEVVLIPSEVNDYYLFPMKEGTILLETTVERRIDPDSYTGDKDPHLRNWN